MKRVIKIYGIRDNDPFEIITKMKIALKDLETKNPQILSSSTTAMLWPTPLFMHIVYIEADDID